MINTTSQLIRSYIAINTQIFIRQQQRAISFSSPPTSTNRFQPLRDHKPAQETQEQREAKIELTKLLDVLLQTKQLKKSIQQQTLQNNCYQRLNQIFNDHNKFHPVIATQFINKLAKDKVYNMEKDTVLLPVWESLASKYKEFSSMNRLNKEQMGIIIWSFGHIDLEAVRNNLHLWHTFETIILNHIGLRQFNNFTLCQVTQSFQKADQGTEQLWSHLEENYIQRKNELDLSGITMVLNAFGKSSHSNLDRLLPAFKPIIFAKIEQLDVLQIMLVLSGITFQYTNKPSQSQGFKADSQDVFEKLANKMIRNNDIAKLEYKQIATLAWAYSSIKNYDKFEIFWNALINQLNNEISVNPDVIMTKAAFQQTITIAKALSYIDPQLTRAFQFWGLFKRFFENTDQLQVQLQRIKWKDFSSILFILSQVKLLHYEGEWSIIFNAFKEKLEKFYDQQQAIKGLTSLTLAKVGEEWEEIYEIIDKKINPKTIDAFLIMNLFWSMGKNVSQIKEETKESLIKKLLPQLNSHLNGYIRSRNELSILSFISNLQWSAVELGIDDKVLWDQMFTLMKTLSQNFNTEHLLSIVPTLYQSQRLDDLELLEQLEIRISELKKDEDISDKITILDTYFHKIRNNEKSQIRK